MGTASTETQGLDAMPFWPQPLATYESVTEELPILTKNMVQDAPAQGLEALGDETVGTLVMNSLIE